MRGPAVTRSAIYAAVAVIALGVAWFHGFARGERKLYEYQAEQARAAVPVVVRQGTVTEKVVTKWRTKVVKIKGDTEYITKEIVRYVPPAADPVLAHGWVRLHDAAAVGAIPEAPSGTDVSAPAVASSTALKGVVGNYGTCHENASQLLALQAWVRHQYETMNLEQLGY